MRLLEILDLQLKVYRRQQHLIKSALLKMLLLSAYNILYPSIEITCHAITWLAVLTQFD